jgi:hypothetical protein
VRTLILFLVAATSFLPLAGVQAQGIARTQSNIGSLR